MAREKSDIEYQVVTVRFPKEIYQEYKKILKNEGKIPTYDLRNYIFSVVEEYEKGQR
ncbi:transcriptional regulator [Lactococcus lactis]|uniref:transcriptional regulator n=1 Tax=Lactococcus lactis TaxID=1358 RepID=UPI00117BA64A|nr:transcriptional regulator [Lactococcus lactis]TRW57957.1 transcriptional regulator [Lactococcus lactis]TRW65898.1 transcriptional regulator [Lactococcus lactis]